MNVWHEAARMGNDLAADEILEQLPFPTGPDWIDKLKRLVIRSHPFEGVVIGHPWEHLFRFFDPEGNLLKEVSRDFNTVMKTKAELEFQYKLNRSRWRFSYPFSDFVVDDRGWLIV